MRSGHIIGTPAQIQEWTIVAFLGVNLVVGFLVAIFCLRTWITKVTWYKRTGGLVPMPRQKMTARQQLIFIVLMVPFAAWSLAAIFLTGWLTPKIWPMQRASLPLFCLICGAPLLLIFALKLSKDRDILKGCIGQEWSASSRSERVWRAALIAWPLSCLVAVLVGGQSLVLLGFKPWFPIPSFLLIVVVVHLAIMAAVARSTRRR